MARMASGLFQNYTGPAKSVMGSSLIDVPASPSNCRLPGNNIKVIMPYQGMLAVGTTSGLTVTDMANTWNIYTAQHRECDSVPVRSSKTSFPVTASCPATLSAPSPPATTRKPLVGTDKGLAALRGSEWLGSRNPDARSA